MVIPAEDVVQQAIQVLLQIFLQFQDQANTVFFVVVVFFYNAMSYCKDQLFLCSHRVFNVSICTTTLFITNDNISICQE